MEHLKNNLEQLKQNIASVCARAGRNPNEVEIVPASKTRSIDEVLALAKLGIATFGENRVQELTAKYLAPPQWDMIGQLQTNKVKYIIDKVRLIQSVDRLPLLQEIEKQAAKIGKVQDVLIEINTGDEAAKGGVRFAEVVSFAGQMEAFSHIRLRGVMAVTPIAIEEEERRALFFKVKEVAGALQAKYPSADVVSMGMSDDYPLAIACGATLIRPGRILFEKK